MNKEKISTNSTVNRTLFVSSLVVIISLFYGDWGKMFYYETIKGFSNAQFYINLNVYISAILYPALAFLSDIWCRKKMLWIALMFLALSGIFLHFDLPLLSTIAIGIAPVTSISMAAYCDVHITNEREPNIINTFLIRPLPWIMFPLLYDKYKVFFISDIALGVFCIISLSLWLKDNRDRDDRKFHFGLLDALGKYGGVVCLIITSAFFLSNWAWSMLFYYLENIEKLTVVAKNFMLSPGICFFFGVLFSRMIFRKKKVLFVQFLDKKSEDEKIDYLKLIIIFSISVIPFIVFISFLMSLLNGSENNIILNSLPLFTFFGGIFIPTIYTFFGSKISYHSLGLVYASLEVIQSMSESIGAWFNTFKIFSSNIYSITLFTLFLTILSLVLLYYLPKVKKGKINF